MTAFINSEPPIDIQEALDRAMGEKEFLMMLLEEFSQGLADQIEQLRRAIARQDGTALTRQSHTLKGAAGNLSAKAMAAVVRRLEAAGEKGDFASSEKLVRDMEGEALRLQRYLGQIDWSSVN